MGKTLYLECKSGISGDMTVGALLDLGADKQLLSEVLSTIKAEGFKVAYNRVKRSGLDCMDFDVILDEKHDGHDHDMDYLYGRRDFDERLEHHHEHRGLKEINEILDATAMSERAKKTAKDMFEILARAESKAHGVPMDQVHFHELGAVDSIVDIVAIAVCLDDLDIDKIIVPKLYDGQGTIRCQHGILPIPVPAVANIVSEYKINMRIIDVIGELVTPTGAAVAALRTSDTLPKEFIIEKIGMGSGKRNYGLAGFLRAMILKEN